MIYTYLSELMWPYLPRPFIGDWFGHSAYGIFYGKPFDESRDFFLERDVKFIVVNINSPIVKQWFNTTEKLFGDFSKCLNTVYIDEISQVYELNNLEICQNKNIQVLGSINTLRLNQSHVLFPFINFD